jgi:hypothetical protein
MRHLLLSFIARLSVARKLILIYALDLSAVIFVSTILINEKFIAIDFARKEIVGNEYIGALRTATLGALAGGGPHGATDAVLEADARPGSARGDLGSSELAQALADKLRHLVRRTGDHTLRASWHRAATRSAGWWRLFNGMLERAGSRAHRQSRSWWPVARAAEAERALIEATPIALVVTAIPGHEVLHANPPAGAWLERPAR